MTGIIFDAVLISYGLLPETSTQAQFRSIAPYLTSEVALCEGQV
jgi:hypothetical protein